MSTSRVCELLVAASPALLAATVACSSGFDDGGTGGSVDPGCVPSTLPAATPLPATCAGVFVSGATGSDTTGDGTRAAPYASLAKALEASPLVVYACAAQTGDTGTVTLPPATTLFGALDCADWHYTGDKTALNPGTPTALVLAPGAGARIEDFHIEAADALALGASSIAILANATTSATLARVELVAGHGADGDAGVSLPDDSSLDGTNGLNGGDDATVCPPPSGATSLPGAGGPKVCGSTDVAGGLGGFGTTGGNSDGSPGNPTPGLGGAAGMGSAPTCVLGAGQGGTSGNPGPDGTGATALGTLSAAGYAGADGTAGTPGDPGGGGGGGRGAGCTSGSTGPAGGGGASGGCGGAGGGIGRAAGGSIALALVGATVTVTDASITTATGGTGGVGGTGQKGGFGGPSGGNAGAAGACDGGPGGNGGDGGGGLGGPSLGVALSSGATVTLTNATYTIGAAGPGGPGGDGKVALDGAPGERCATLDFDTASCTPP